MVAKVKEEEGQDVNHIPGTSLSSERVARTTRTPQYTYMTLTAYLVLIFKNCQRISRSLFTVWGP